MASIFEILGSSTYMHFDLDAITNNIEVMKKHCPEAEVLAVVKAYAYGHGLIPLAEHLKSIGVARLAVATIDEGRQLREQGIAGPIHVFGNVAEWQMSKCLYYELLPSVSNDAAVKGMANAMKENDKQTWQQDTNNNILDIPNDDSIGENIKRLSKRVARGTVVIKMDTGMWRNGCLPNELKALVQVCKEHGVPLDGVYTHLSDSYDDMPYTNQQLDAFSNALNVAGVSTLTNHAANTGAILKGIATNLTFVRPGKGVYGLPPPGTSETMKEFGFQTAMVVKTRPTITKRVPKGSTVGYGRTYECKDDEWLSVLPMGFADGYHRTLSNRGLVLREETGELCPVVGTVSMDCIQVRTTTPARPDEVFQLITRGYHHMTSVDAFQRMADTTASDIMIRQSLRFPRIYTKGGKIQSIYKFNVPQQLETDKIKMLESLL